jgi:hydroxyacylglutathione hydrolase
MEVNQLKTGELQTNCYILSDEKTSEIVVIDPGDDALFLIEAIESKHPSKIILFATHGHFDHILASFALIHTYNIPLLIHKSDLFLVSRMQKSASFYLKHHDFDPPPDKLGSVNDGDEINIGDNIIKIIHLPGHTPGSVGIYFKNLKYIFSGDLVFADGSVGRTDFEYSNKQDLNASINKISKFSGETKIYPGHGDFFILGNNPLFR